MARTRIVSDENPRAIHQLQQIADTLRRGQVFLARFLPPRPLVRIASNLHPEASFPKAPHNQTVTLQRPTPTRLPRTGVDQPFAVPPYLGHHQALPWRQCEAE